MAWQVFKNQKFHEPQIPFNKKGEDGLYGFNSKYEKHVDYYIGEFMGKVNYRTPAYLWYRSEKEQKFLHELVRFNASMKLGAFKKLEPFIPKANALKESLNSDMIKILSYESLYKICDSFTHLKEDIGEFNEAILQNKKTATNWHINFLVQSNLAAPDAYKKEKEKMGIENQAKLIMKCNSVDISHLNDILESATDTGVIEIPFISAKRTINPYGFSNRCILEQEIVEYLRL